MKFFQAILPLLVVGAMASPILCESDRSIGMNVTNEGLDETREQLGELGNSDKRAQLGELGNNTDKREQLGELGNNTDKREQLGELGNNDG
jgi:hypothetical protein